MFAWVIFNVDHTRITITIMSNLFIAGDLATKYPFEIQQLRKRKRHIGITDYRGDNTTNNISNYYAPLNQPQLALCDDNSFVLSFEHQAYLQNKYGDDFMKRLRQETYGSVDKYSSYAPPLFSPSTVEIIIHGQEIVLTPREANTLLNIWQENQQLAMISLKTPNLRH